MLIDKPRLSRMLLSSANLWMDNISLLSDIDSRFGDGDHGITIGKIANLVTFSVDNWGEETIQEFISTLGSGIMGISGGSAGPLYGTLVGGLSEALGDETEINGTLLKKMLLSCQEAMFGITKARVGDKTMMDALIPAVEAAQAASDTVTDILSAAAKASVAGANSTESFASNFGRARSYGDRTIGTPDAGALSTSFLFRGLYEGL